MGKITEMWPVFNPECRQQTMVLLAVRIEIKRCFETSATNTMRPGMSVILSIPSTKSVDHPSTRPGHSCVKGAHIHLL